MNLLSRHIPTLRTGHHLLALIMLVTVLIPVADAQAESADADHAAAVKQIFRTRCLECHGDTRREADIHILQRDSYVGEGLPVTPGDLDESYLFDLLVTADEDYRMPESPRPPLSEQEIETVRQWIAEGAPEFPADVVITTSDEDAPQAFGQEYVLEQILAYLQDVPRERRKSLRFFSSNHLLTAGATREEMRLNRQALTKALNHLSWEPTLVQPKVVDAGVESIFAVDIRQLGWHDTPFDAVHAANQHVADDFDIFDMILLDYPYGVAFEGSESFDRLQEIYLRPAGLVRPVPYIRIDWLVSVATMPPLYEDILQLPRELADLERLLGVDGDGNIASQRARRAGMTLSGVSQNNRVVERHPARYGYYWKSYDFETSSGLQNMFVDPMDFHYAGGEMIWSLPNGMQGYLVTDNRGTRLLEAPTSIVTDKFAEDKTVRNGLSCIRCHDRGMKRFHDNIRNAFAALPSGRTRREVLELYPEQDEMDELLDNDQDAFLHAVQRSLGETQQQEPLTPVARTFHDAPLTLRQAAAELGEQDAQRLTAAFRLPEFTRLGLSGLSSGEVIRRDSWEDYYSQVIRQLGTGVPVPAVDGVTRPDFLPRGFAEQLTIRTNKRSNIFSPGEKLIIEVTNHSDDDMFIELLGVSTKGRMASLTPHIRKLAHGETFRFPESGDIDIRPQLGRELITVYGSPTKFSPGVILRADNMDDRIVHDFFHIDSDGSVRRTAHDLVRKTLRIETR